MKADSLETQRLGELAQQDTAMKLDIAEKQARQNDELIARQQRLAQQKITLDAIQLGIKNSMSDDELVRRKSEEVQQQITSSVAPQPALALNSTAPALPEQQPLVQQVGGWGKDADGNPIPQVITNAPAPTSVPYQHAPNLQHDIELVYQQIAVERQSCARDGILTDDIVIGNEANDGDAARLSAARDLLRRLQEAHVAGLRRKVADGFAPKA